MPVPPGLRFVPSRVEGLADVDEVLVYPDRLELGIRGGRKVVRFADIARWPQPAWLWKRLFAIGIRPRWLPVADRDWCHAPAERFFRFYTDPPLVLCMPASEPANRAEGTCFDQLRVIVHSSGYHTFDLG
jgi:hypothetical protein